MEQHSKFERFSVFFLATLPTLMKVFSTWLTSAVLVVGSVYLFVKDHHIWGSFLSLLTITQFIFFTVARTIGFVLGARDSYIMLKYEDIPDIPPTYSGTNPPIYAGFMLRSGAFYVDSIILIIPCLIFRWAALFLRLPLDPVLTQTITDLILCWIYFSILPASTLQGTFGMRACGLRVCDYSFDRIGFCRSAARATVMLISLITVVGCVMAAFTKKKQSLHDLCSKTYVVSV